MKASDILTLMFLELILGFFGYIIADIIGILIFCTIIAYILFTIICWLKYGKKYGVYRLPAFCMHIFNSKGELIASFKGDDWTVLETPLPLTHKERLKIKIRDESGEETEKVLELDYHKIYRDYLDKALKNIIPDPKHNPTSSSSKQLLEQETLKEPKTLTFDDVVENALSRIGDTKSYLEFQKLSYEDKLRIAKLMRNILASYLFEEEKLRVYKITSLTNEIYLLWIAQSEPQQYYTYTEKQYFKKWKVWLSRKGLPVIEAWGAEMRTPYKGKLTPITYEIEGQELKAYFCMPIQDERYRYLRILLMQQYDIIASAVSKYVEDILEALPYTSRIDLIMKEMDVYKQEVEIYREGIQQIYGELSELSSMVYRNFALVSQLSGVLARLPIPKETKQKLSELGISFEEQKSKLQQIAGTLKRLVIREKEEKPKVEIEKLEPTKEKEETKIE